MIMERVTLHQCLRLNIGNTQYETPFAVGSLVFVGAYYSISLSLLAGLSVLNNLSQKPPG